MLEAVTTLLLAIHLLAMNVASAGPLAGAWLRGRGGRASGIDGDRLERGARRTFVWSLTGLIIGAIVGGAMLLAPSEGMRAALTRFPENTYWYAGAEILFSAVCIIGCWKLTRLPKLTWLLAVATATNLLYHFPPLMAVLGELAADAHWTDDAVLDRATLKRLWLRPEILSLWAHFALAAIAVGFTAALAAIAVGFTAALAAIAVGFTAALAACDRTTGQGADGSDRSEQIDGTTARRLAGTALAATVLQIPVGIWLLLASDDAAQQSMMGGSWLATIGLAGGVWVALGVMQSLAAIAWDGTDRRQLYRACVLLALTVLLMSMTLRSSRRADAPAAAVERAAAHSSTLPRQ